MTCLGWCSFTVSARRLKKVWVTEAVVCTILLFQLSLAQAQTSTAKPSGTPKRSAPVESHADLPPAQDIAQWMKENLPQLTRLSQQCTASAPGVQDGKLFDDSVFSVTSIGAAGCSVDILHQIDSIFAWTDNGSVRSFSESSHSTFHVQFDDIAGVDGKDQAERRWMCVGHGFAVSLRAASGKTFHQEGVKETSGDLKKHEPFTTDTSSVVLFFLDSKSRDRFQKAAADLTARCGGKLQKSLY